MVNFAVSRSNCYTVMALRHMLEKCIRKSVVFLKRKTQHPSEYTVLSVPDASPGLTPSGKWSMAA